MNILMLAAAIRNVNNGGVVVKDDNWDYVVAQPTLTSAGWRDLRWPNTTTSNLPLEGVGRFGTPCMRFTAGTQRMVYSGTPFSMYGNFTIEGWYNFSDLTRQNQYLFEYGNNQFIMRWYNGKLGLFNGSTLILDSGVVPVTGRWYHFAVVRNFGNLMIFVDGVLTAQVQYGASLVFTTFSIGNYNGGGNYYVDGLVDQVRVTRKTLYTEDFAIPAGPFVSGGLEAAYDPWFGNVKLLVNADFGAARNAIDSTNFVSVGNPQIDSTMSRFGNASMKFNGSDAYALPNTGTDYQFGNEDFTIEAWVCPSAVAGSTVNLVGRRANSVAGGWRLCLSSMRPVLYLSSNNSTWGVTLGAVAGTELPVGVWSHVAATRQGSELRLYINGRRIAEAVSTITTFAGSVDLAIGASADGSEGFVGNIDSVRITRGVARYCNAMFTPKMVSDFATTGTIVPGEGDPYFGQNMTLMPMIDSYDSGFQQIILTTVLGDTALDNDTRLFGKPTLKIKSNENGLTFTPGKAQLSGRDFTIEAWVKSDYSSTNVTQSICDQWHSSSSGAWLFGIRNSRLVFWHASSSYVSSSVIVDDNQWHHVAVCRRNDTIYLFVDGVQVGSVVSSVALTYNGVLRVGAPNGTTLPTGFTTNIARLRITSGKARYVGNFTPDENTIQLKSLAA